ncbi:recombinase family protein [Desulfitobacterium chlororespirans]|uniref:Recombinase zinc beta ribbon domain-containing protein n=1 Tax=Desulfitobacterium chlororespirans DSM 11544 TaxID=1121395 RepID=A0A1M7UWB3_9FIRM|nr:recombinase family protein [Desulfitobacterium chlororespirans]SHN87264.1 Recombinase zinc beta ribbon domain-containing protein [Desulfitobacterium chlororespirans DSM 11544]
MVYIPYGFVQKQDGIFVEPQQAEVVKEIFQRYLNGDSLGGIADFLFRHGISSPTGQEKWTRPAISKLLSNAKYIGYIISFEDYFAVQVDKGNRSNIDEDTNQRKATRYSSQNVLSSLLVCVECGAHYRRIPRPSGEVVWRCANKVEHGKKICQNAPSLSKDVIKEYLCTALNMAEWDEEAIKSAIERILIRHDGGLEIEYKHEMRHDLEY